MQPIDAVIMWVDGDDEIFRRQHSNYSGAVAKEARKHEGKGRHRSSGELIYCLRGIEKNIPWINKIHIVTSGQIPDGLDFNDPRLNLVIHSDIFPDLSSLPTFNSFAIDSCVHRIPGISDRFIRFSDDFLVINYTPPEALLGDDGQGKYYLGSKVPDLTMADTVRTRYLMTLAFNRFLLGTIGVRAAHAPMHVPQMRSVGICNQIEAKFADDLACTRGRRFRTDRDITMLFFYPHFMAGEKKAPLNRKNQHDLPEFTYFTWARVRQALVGDSQEDWRATIAKAKEDEALFLNVNDHLGDVPNPKDLSDYLDLMDSLLPQPATWEIAPCGQNEDRGKGA